MAEPQKIRVNWPVHTSDHANEMHHLLEQILHVLIAIARQVGVDVEDDD